jgi:hypothetical protein
VDAVEREKNDLYLIVYMIFHHHNVFLAFDV